MKKREEEIRIASTECYLEEVKQMDTYFGQAEEWTKGITFGFIKGAKWADNNPRMFKGQTEKMGEREIAFMDWWIENHDGERPTFADAIAWAEREMIDKACEWLEENYYNVYQGTWQEIREQFIEDFKKAMEE